MPKHERGGGGMPPEFHASLSSRLSSPSSHWVKSGLIDFKISAFSSASISPSWPANSSIAVRLEIRKASRFCAVRDRSRSALGRQRCVVLHVVIRSTTSRSRKGRERTMKRVVRLRSEGAFRRQNASADRPQRLICGAVRVLQHVAQALLCDRQARCHRPLWNA